MKKLGTPDSWPPNVEGKGGVSAEGETAGLCEPASAFFSWVVGLLACAFAFLEVLGAGVTTVGCWERCVLTSGAGTVVVSVVVVDGGGVEAGVVELGVVEVGTGVLEDVLVLVGVGSGVGGAGTVVTSEALVAVSPVGVFV